MASSKQPSLPSIQLTDTNYQEWSEMMHAWARMRHGKDHLIPPSGVSDPPIFPQGGEAEKKAWERLDDEIAAGLLMSLSSSQRVHCRNPNATAATIWKTLREVHQSKTFVSYFTDYMLLHSIHYEDGTSMQAYISKHAELRERITAAGLYQPESHYSGILIHSLPDSWDVLRQTLQRPINEGKNALPSLPSSQYDDCRRCTESSNAASLTTSAASRASNGHPPSPLCSTKSDAALRWRSSHSQASATRQHWWPPCQPKLPPTAGHSTQGHEDPPHSGSHLRLLQGARTHAPAMP